MYKNFNITESEKEQILNRLKENGYKQPLNKNIISEEKLSLRELSPKFKVAHKGDNGLLILQDKQDDTYGVFNPFEGDWVHGHQPKFVEVSVSLYQTQTRDYVLLTKYGGEGGKVFYIIQRVGGNSTDDVQTVAIFNHNKFDEMTKDLKLIHDNNDEDISLNEGKGKQTLVNTYKKLIK